MKKKNIIIGIVAIVLVLIMAIIFITSNKVNEKIYGNWYSQRNGAIYYYRLTEDGKVASTYWFDSSANKTWTGTYKVKGKKIILKFEDSEDTILEYEESTDVMYEIQNKARSIKYIRYTE